MTERRFFRLALMLPIMMAAVAWCVPGGFAIFLVMPVLGAGIPYAVFAVIVFYRIGHYPETHVPRRMLHLSPVTFFPFVAVPGAILFFTNWSPGREGEVVILPFLYFLATVFGYTIVYGYFYVFCVWLCSLVVLKKTSQNV